LATRKTKTPEAMRRTLNAGVLDHLAGWLTHRAEPDSAIRKMIVDDILQCAHSELDEGWAKTSRALCDSSRLSLALARREIEGSQEQKPTIEPLRAGLARGFYGISLLWAFDRKGRRGHESWDELRGIDDTIVLFLFACSADCPQLARWAAAHLANCVEANSFEQLCVGEHDVGAWGLVVSLAACVHRGTWRDPAIWPLYAFDDTQDMDYIAPLLAAIGKPATWRTELERYCDTRLAHAFRRPTIDAPRAIRDQGLQAFMTEHVPYKYLPLELTAMRSVYRWFTGDDLPLDIDHPSLPRAWVDLPSLRAPGPQFAGADKSPVLAELWDDEFAAMARNAGARWFGEFWQPKDIPDLPSAELA
jgi:hypothetical protein